MTDPGKSGDNTLVSYPSFPELTRKPSLSTDEQTVDPTLRDSLENGMEGTMLAFKRRRRTFSVSIGLLTGGDKAELDLFVLNQAKYGSQAFYFVDTRDLHASQVLLVRFAENGLPRYRDAGWVQGEFRQNCTFIIREM